MSALLLLLAAAQEFEPPPVTYPRIAAASSTIQGFVPSGWRIEKQVRGDLNRDRRADAVLVLRMTAASNHIAASWDPERLHDTNPRMLVAVFARPGGGYALAAQDHRLIPRLDNPNMDDPFDDVTIARGAMRVTMHLFLSAGGWSAGSSAYTFRWEDGAFRLIGFDRDSVQRNTGELREVSINYASGRKLVRTGKLESDRMAERWTNIRKNKQLSLADIGDGLMFDPEGAEE